MAQRLPSRSKTTYWISYITHLSNIQSLRLTLDATDTPLFSYFFSACSPTPRYGCFEGVYSTQHWQGCADWFQKNRVRTSFVLQRSNQVPAPLYFINCNCTLLMCQTCNVSVISGTFWAIYGGLPEELAILLCSISPLLPAASTPNLVSIPEAFCVKCLVSVDLKGQFH